MGRAGWGILFMTLVSISVAFNGLYMGNSLDDSMAENPTLDYLYDTSDTSSIQRSDSFEFATYQYIDPDSDSVSTGGNDYYVSSWTFMKTFLNFIKDFFVPFSILGSVDGFPTILIWLLSMIWDLIYALLFIEIIWRFNLFD